MRTLFYLSTLVTTQLDAEFPDLADILAETDAYVIGGCLRDIINNGKITQTKDIDIIALPDSANLILNKLLSLGGTIDMFSNKGLFSFCYIRFNKLIIHLITYNYKPNESIDKIKNTRRKAKGALISQLIKVDISTSGLIFSVKEGLKEIHDNALFDIENKVFSTYPHNSFFNLNSLTNRIESMKQDGYTLMTENTDDIVVPVKPRFEQQDIDEMLIRLNKFIANEIETLVTKLRG